MRRHISKRNPQPISIFALETAYTYPLGRHTLTFLFLLYRFVQCRIQPCDAFKPQPCPHTLHITSLCNVRDGFNLFLISGQNSCSA